MFNENAFAAGLVDGLEKTGKEIEKLGVGVGGYDVVGDKLLIYQHETGQKISPKAKERPWFYKDLPRVHRKNIRYGEPASGDRLAWDADVEVPVAEAEKHPKLKEWLEDAKKHSYL